MTQARPFILFNEDSAKKSGGSDFLQEGGAYICTIESAIYTKAGTGSHGIEFSIKTSEGLKANYITAYYAKDNNEPINSGQSLLNALMGFIGAAGLSFSNTTLDGAQVSIVPELMGKTIGLFLQKKLYTKNDGSEGYKFDIRCPFDAKTRQTFKERIASKTAESIDRMASSYKDIDDRKDQSSSAQNYDHSAPYPDM